MYYSGLESHSRRSIGFHRLEQENPSQDAQKYDEHPLKGENRCDRRNTAHDCRSFPSLALFDEFTSAHNLPPNNRADAYHAISHLGAISNKTTITNRAKRISNRAIAHGNIVVTRRYNIIIRFFTKKTFDKSSKKSHKSAPSTHKSQAGSGHVTPQIMRHPSFPNLARFRRFFARNCGQKNQDG